MARWSDGFEHSVAEISCEDLQTIVVGFKNTRRGTDGVGGDALREQTSSVNELRHDRTMLMRLFEQGPQICQVRVDALPERFPKSMLVFGMMDTLDP